MAITISGTSGLSAGGASFGLVQDTNGYVKFPYQPCCIGTLDIYASLTTPLGLIISYNQGSIGNSSTNRITAPVAGRYLVHMRQLVQVSTTGVYLAIYVNGVDVKHAYAGSTGFFADMQCTHILNLAANDYITFAYLTVAPSVTWNALHSEFCVYLLG